MHMRTAYLVHKQHKDEAQDQRHSDAGVELLVTVLMFPAVAQAGLSFTLWLGHLQNPNLAVTVVSTCEYTIKHSNSDSCDY